MEYLVQAQDIHKQFAGHKALDGVTFNVPQQSIFGLLGPNGAGKTTLIRIINRILAPDQGQVLYDGQPLQAEHIKRIGYLPEERGLYRKMRVAEQALYLARLKGMSKADARQHIGMWFEKFGMSSWWNRKVEELSKGMQQKVQFIITVLHQPQLLILDEPFSGFDPLNTELIKQEILRLRDEGTTIIFSTHNMGSVEEICDHIALINQSRNVLEGAVPHIKQQYRDRTYKVRYQGNGISLANSLWGGFKLIGTPEAVGEGVFQATIRLPQEGQTNELLQALLPNLKVLGLEEVLPSMHDIFIRQVTELQGAPDDTTPPDSDG